MSTKGRYGLRAMIDLALYSKNDTVPLISIAERQDISKVIWSRYFQLFEKRDWLKALRVRKGVYIQPRLKILQ